MNKLTSIASAGLAVLGLGLLPSTALRAADQDTPQSQHDQLNQNPSQSNWQSPQAGQNKTRPDTKQQYQNDEQQRQRLNSGQTRPQDSQPSYQQPQKDESTRSDENNDRTSDNRQDMNRDERQQQLNSGQTKPEDQYGNKTDKDETDSSSADMNTPATSDSSKPSQ